jgi:hypothetical protein
MTYWTRLQDNVCWIAVVSFLCSAAACAVPASPPSEPDPTRQTTQAVDEDACQLAVDLETCNALGCAWYACNVSCHAPDEASEDAICAQPPSEFWVSRCGAITDLDGCNAAGCGWYACNNSCHAPNEATEDAICAQPPSQDWIDRCKANNDLDSCNAAGCGWYACNNSCHAPNEATEDAICAQPPSLYWINRCDAIDDLNQCNAAGCGWYACNNSCHAPNEAPEDVICGGQPDCTAPQGDRAQQLYDRFFTGGIGGIERSGNWAYAAAMVEYCALTHACLNDPDNASFTGVTVPVDLVDRMVNERPAWVNVGFGASCFGAVYMCPTGGCSTTNMERAPKQAWRADLWIETSARDAGISLPQATDRIDELYDPTGRAMINYALAIAGAVSTTTVSGFSRGATVAVAYGATQSNGATVYAYGMVRPWRNSLQGVSAVDAFDVWNVLIDHQYVVEVGTFGWASVRSVHDIRDPVALYLTPAQVALFAEDMLIYHDYRWLNFTTLNE